MHKVHTPIGGRKDGRTDGRTDRRTERRKAKNHVPPLFFEKAGDKKRMIPGVDLTRQLCWWLEPIRLLYEGQGHLNS